VSGFPFEVTVGLIKSIWNLDFLSDIIYLILWEDTFVSPRDFDVLLKGTSELIKNNWIVPIAFIQGYYVNEFSRH